MRHLRWCLVGGRGKAVLPTVCAARLMCCRFSTAMWWTTWSTTHGSSMCAMPLPRSRTVCAVTSTLPFLAHHQNTCASTWSMEGMARHGRRDPVSIITMLLMHTISKSTMQNGAPSNRQEQGARSMHAQYQPAIEPSYNHCQLDHPQVWLHVL
jgi:hypothetical protein